MPNLESTFLNFMVWLTELSDQVRNAFAVLHLLDTLLPRLKIRTHLLLKYHFDLTHRNPKCDSPVSGAPLPRALGR